jgi:transcriptional regulator with XRE-family HTH domain
MSWGGRSTQEQSAEYANINTLYLHKLESGRGHSSLIVLCRLKTALDCTRNALLEGIET